MNDCAWQICMGSVRRASRSVSGGSRDRPNQNLAWPKAAAKTRAVHGDCGFKLLLDRGAWYGNNHYSHATTYTSVGHATLLSCAHPYKHGVVGNDWIDKKTRKRLYSTEDTRHKYLGEETAEHSGTSPF